jgi:hypothetical protein
MGQCKITLKMSPALYQEEEEEEEYPRRFSISITNQYGNVTD